MTISFLSTQATDEAYNFGDVTEEEIDSLAKEFTNGDNELFQFEQEREDEFTTIKEAINHRPGNLLSEWDENDNL